MHTNVTYVYAITQALLFVVGLSLAMSAIALCFLSNSLFFFPLDDVLEGSRVMPPAEEIDFADDVLPLFGVVFSLSLFLLSVTLWLSLREFWVACLAYFAYFSVFSTASAAPMNNPFARVLCLVLCSSALAKIINMFN